MGEGGKKRFSFFRGRAFFSEKRNGPLCSRKFLGGNLLGKKKEKAATTMDEAAAG